MTPKRYQSHCTEKTKQTLANSILRYHVSKISLDYFYLLHIKHSNFKEQ